MSQPFVFYLDVDDARLDEPGRWQFVASPPGRVVTFFGEEYVAFTVPTAMAAQTAVRVILARVGGHAGSRSDHADPAAYLGATRQHCEGRRRRSRRRPGGRRPT